MCVQGYVAVPGNMKCAWDKCVVNKCAAIRIRSSSTCAACPPDVSEGVARAREGYGDDGHSDTYYLLDELLKLR